MMGWSWNDVKFRSWAKSKAIKWNFTPVAAPHMNGCSESLIRITKEKLNEVMRNHRFTFSEMVTIIKEIQQIINSHWINWF
jgi:hypothetical protein